MKPAEWLRVFESEYLDSYIPAGGSTVRFLTGPRDAVAAARDGLLNASRARGFLTVEVESNHTRVHQVQELFFAVSRQVDWVSLTTRVAEQAVRESGYAVPQGEVTFHSIAAGVDQGTAWTQVRDDVRRWLSRDVFKDYQMVAEFRQAAMALLDDALSSSAEPSERSDLILEWLHGELPLMGGLTSTGIYQKVARSSARDMLLSLCHWTRKAGHPGIVITVDIGAYSAARHADTTGQFYRRPACLEMYEVIRQFIDATDAMEGCALVFATPPGWREDEARGLGAYRALRYRVSEEARDETRENPVAMLIRLE